MAYQRFSYEDLGDDQFENLIVYLAQELFGIAVHGFAAGPDGGRDAKFIGTAAIFPSSSALWSGTTIFQAKHTMGHNKSFSETDFYSKGSETCILEKEILRIKKLVSAGQLDNYFLAANRRLTGDTQQVIVDRICEATGLDQFNVFICGVEQLEVWLKKYPHVVTAADLDPVDAPLLVTSDQLAEVVEAFARNKDAFDLPPEDTPTPRVSYEEKNKLNGMTPEFAKTLRQRYLKDTSEIASFLASPKTLSLESYTTRRRKSLTSRSSRSERPINHLTTFSTTSWMCCSPVIQSCVSGEIVG